MTVLDLTASPAELTAALVDVPSVSGDERVLADAVEAALRCCPGLTVRRDGDAVLARTDSGRPGTPRVVLAGHLDTVPVADNLPSRRDAQRLYGCGTSDMKSGLALMLRQAAVAESRFDRTWVCYDAEEVAADRNGLGRLARTCPDWLRGDLAVLFEPTGGLVEAGCQGTMRFVVDLAGRRAHTARAWLGTNAIHRAAPLLARLADYQPRSVTLDGCTYREGLSAVAISGGVAGNVVPDACAVTVNFRFAPDRSEADARAHVAEVLDGLDVADLRVTDSAPGALPGLDHPLAQDFLRAVAAPARAKYGWTDVARFAALGIPALNFGPGDPNLAHTREEWVDLDLVSAADRVLAAFLAP